MTNYKLSAETRTTVGRKVKKLRQEGILPANIFGQKTESTSIQLPLAVFKKLFAETGETSVIELTVEDKKHPVLISNVQNDPLSNEIIHVDFHEVDLKEKVTARVPVEIVGESPAEKQGLGTAVQYVDEIEVEALPTDLPENFTVDISALTDVEQQIKIGDIKVDAKVVAIQDDLETVIIKVEPQREEEVAPEPVETPTEGETPAETPSEGETSSEE